MVNLLYGWGTDGYGRDILIYDLMCVEKCICAMNMFAHFWSCSTSWIAWYACMLNCSAPIAGVLRTSEYWVASVFSCVQSFTDLLIQKLSTPIAASSYSLFTTQLISTLSSAFALSRSSILLIGTQLRSQKPIIVTPICKTLNFLLCIFK